MLPPEPAADLPRHALAAEVVACQCVEVPESNRNTDTIGPKAPYAFGARAQYDYRVSGRWSVGAVGGYEYVTYPDHYAPDHASVGLLGAVLAHRTNGEFLRGGVRLAGGFSHARDGAAAWTTPGYFLEFDGELAVPVVRTVELFLDVGILRVRQFYWGADRPRYGKTWMYAMLIVPLSGSLGLRYRF